MADELDQVNESNNCSEAKIELLRKEINELVSDNEYLQTIVNEARKKLERYYERIDSLNDQLTSAKKENEDLKSVNTAVVKKLMEREEDYRKLGGRADVLYFEQLAQIRDAKLQQETRKSDIKNLELQAEKLKSDVKNLESENEKLKSDIQNLESENEKLKSELGNVKLQNETSPSEVDKLMVLYWCSEKAKYVASMKLLNSEDNIRKLRKELHSLQIYIASKNVGNEVNGSEKPETFATGSIKKKHIESLEKEVTGMTDKLCEEFEAKMEEKRSCLITKLGSFDDHIQVLKKLCVKLKKKKLVLLDIMEEMDSNTSYYRKRLECV